MQKIELLIIDPQNDFCNPGIDLTNYNDAEVKIIESIVQPEMINPGALFVPGADDDMTRLADMITRLKNKLFDIHVTMDSHHLVDIAHPIFWIDSNGNHPDPFTIITGDDIAKGFYTTAYEPYRKRALEYVNKLAKNNRYPLCIWPPHCLIGKPGHNIFPALEKALAEWESDFAIVDYVTKGSNFWTEHYSAVQADVPDPEDPGTQLNWQLIDTLQSADIILLAGEAKSHCLANTVMDIADNFGEDNIKKMILLEDATSNVPDPPGTTMFTDFANHFVTNMVSRGMQISTTVDFLR